MRSRLIKQGVVFLNNPILGEVMVMSKYPESDMPVFAGLSAETIKQEGRIPKVAGYCFFGRCLVFVNTVEMLDDIYVK
jgi:hypothetical protein